MEDLLLQIVKEATGTKLSNLRNAAQIAHDKLYRQHGIHRDPSYELRSVCLTAIQMALDTRRPKFITYALNGMHKIIKDERFYIGLEPEDDSLWLPAQLLRTTSCISTQGTSSFNEDTLVNVLRLFLAMACSPTCTLNGRLLIEILSRCGECWENGPRAIKAASLAAASQCLRTFCAFLKDETEEVLRTAPAGLISIAQASAVYNEVIPVLQWLCSRLVEPKVGSPKKSEVNGGSLYLTECILTLTTALPKNVQANPHFTAFLWQKFCPTLAAALGSPGRVILDKKFTYKDALHIIENETRGFFTGPGLDGPQARCVYLTAIQLLRIAGGHGSLRPMLEALFHRMLLLPSPQNRTEPLRCVKEIFKSPGRLVDLSVILYLDKNQGQSCSDDMALFRLIIDAMEECAVSSQSGNGSCENSLQSSVECIVALMASLQTLCSGDIDETILNNQTVDILNNRYGKIREADYTGPLTYQSMARLPAPYRDAVAELRQNGFETSSASDSDVEQLEPDICSNGSGDTEGPEEENHSSSDDISSKNDNSNNWPYSFLEAPTPVRSDGDFDRHHAREFTKSLTNQLVPKLLQLRTSIEVDECMQEFASVICQENSLNYSDFEYNLTAINADGIYLATYSALLLSLQLMQSGHYEDVEEQILIPLSEQQFVTTVQNAGVLVYLSTFWLCELYQCIIATNPLISLQEKEDCSSRCALVDMLRDAGGLGQTQMLSDWQRLQSVVQQPIEYNERREAAKKLSRRLLTCCWESMVAILSAGLGDVPLSTKNRLVVLSQKTLKLKKRTNQCGEALFALSLDGLHAAATLSNSLNLQHLSGKILNLLSSNVCQTVGPRISASQALSMDVVLSGGLELGSYSAECWMPVFTVCRHVAQLEHELFSLQNANMIGSTNTNGNSTINNNSNVGRDFETGEKTTIAAGTGNDKLNLTSCPIDDDETCVDVYSFLQAPLQSPNANVATILKLYSATNEIVLLSQLDSASVLCALSHQAENLFCEAAERLSLPSLCQFLKQLCKASREQLYRNLNSKRGPKVWWPSRAWKQRTDSSLPLSLLLHRVGDVTLRVFRSSRPLLHILKVWAITGPHLMDAACHRERSISKRAIQYIHDVITALLVEQSELPHFHFNEALLKPFENLLSMETCDIDVQDQIVACLYEIVEAHRTEIRSGWRPLFGTLRNARNRPLNLTNITDIFRVFLESDNTLVFANAGLDCILCLLSYLEISGANNNNNYNNAQLMNNSNNNINNNGIIIDDDTTIFRPIEFLHETLKFLERCSSILAFMYNMPKCPNFHSTYKIKGISYTHVIDANIPNSMENFTYFGNDYLQNTNEQHMISYRSLHIDKESIIKIDELDKSSGVLKVWFLLLDGLTNSLIVCPIPHQSAILSTILKLFKTLGDSPGIDFGFYSINHLLIPMIQDWLRYVNKTHNNWQPIEKNFKHCCGMTTDLVVEFILKSQKRLGTSNGNVAAATTGNSMNTTNTNKMDQQKNIKLKCTKIQRPIDNLKFILNGITETTINSNNDTNSNNNNNTNSNVTNNNNNSNNGIPIPPLAADSSSSSDDNNYQETPTRIPSPASLALKQMLLVLIECTAQPQETISRVGVSCLKHLILSTGHLFNENQWMIAASAIHRACTVTIAPLRQLSFAFHEKSNSFYGDCATVKVVARRDSTIEELQRLNALAQQVFLMDGQREQSPSFTSSTSSSSSPSSLSPSSISSSLCTSISSSSISISRTNIHSMINGSVSVANNMNGGCSVINGTDQQQKLLTDDRSYSFLLYPLTNNFGQNLDNFVIRIPYRNLIVGLLANQMLLQLVAKLLLGNLKCVPTAVHTCIFDNYATNSIPDLSLGFRSKEILLRCVKQYLTSSLEFDSRPGLKFLMQKVSNIDYAANLYKQMTSSWMIYFISMVDTYLSDIELYNLNMIDLNYILESCSRLNTSSVKKKENFVRYLFSLQDVWNLVCENYLNHLNNNNNNSNITATSIASDGKPLKNQEQNNKYDDNNSLDDSNDDLSIEESISASSEKEQYSPTKLLTIDEQNNNNNNYYESAMMITTTISSSTTTVTTTTTSTIDATVNSHQKAQRLNPFDVMRNNKSIEINTDCKSISPEIEQQRATSILKDLNSKNAALAQLVIASMELLRSLPENIGDYLRLLMTPTIREAFRLVQLQGTNNDSKK